MNNPEESSSIHPLEGPAVTDPIRPPVGRLPGALLLLIVCCAGVLRFADLDGCPAGLFRDEAEKGYNGWALARSGGALDFAGGTGPGPEIQWRRLPWMINVMGGKTSAIYQYASIPFTGLGGLSVATARMASAFAGTLTVALLGLLLMRAWGAGAGLAAAAWLTLCPWHLNFSRWALEGIFVPLFISLTLAGLWGIERRRRWGAPVAGAGLGWLFYAYSGAQPFVLAWGVCLLALYFRRMQWKSWPLWLGLVLFLVPVIPTVLVRLEPGGSSRLARIAIWSDSGGTAGLTALEVGGRFVRNYLAHFDPRFLFLSGDRLPRHNAAGTGELTLLDTLLLPLGLIVALRQRRPLAGALLAAFLCGPLAAAITKEGIPHALRSLPMLIPAVAWSGLGIITVARWIRERVAGQGGLNQDAALRRGQVWAAVFVVAALLLGGNDFMRYWRAGHQSPLVAVSFEGGERNAWETIAKDRKPGQRVFVNGYIPYAPYYQLFFMQPEPRAVVRDGLEKGGFIYFNPETVTPERLQAALVPGDWLVQALGCPPAAFGLTQEELGRAGAIWVAGMQR